MQYTIVRGGTSASFPDDHALFARAAKTGEVAVVLGSEAGAAFRKLRQPESLLAVLIELGNEP